MNRPLRILGVIVVGIVLIGTCALWLGRSRGQSALEKYKIGLRAKGEKLSAEELGYPRPPESAESLDRLQAAVTLTGRMPFQPATFEFMPFVGPGLVRRAWASSPPPTRSTAGATGNASDWESISAQFNKGADITADLREAVRVPPRYFYNDPTNFISGRRGPFVTIRNAAQWLAGDVMVALRAGQLDRAAQDMRALTLLTHFLREDHTLVSQMVRVAVAGLGLSVTWQALQADGWNEKQLSGVQRDWEAVNFADAFETGMLGERALGESLFGMMKSASSLERARFLQMGTLTGPVQLTTAEDYFEAFVVIPFWAAHMEDDELFFLKHHQINFDAIRRLSNGVPWREVETEMDSNQAALSRAFGSPMGKYRYLLSAIAIPNFVKGAGVCVKSETQRRMTVTVLALERYKLETGGYPRSLETLIPRFLSAMPMDLMSAKPLCYRLDTDGTFTLYSVGEDGRDDGGDATLAGTTNKFEFWSGRDAVWPVAAGKD